MHKTNLLKLWSYLFWPNKSRKLRIYLLRGGLGNQLFQIFGIAKLASSSDFDVIFSDYDVRINPRDKKGASSLELNVESLFSRDCLLHKADWSINLFIRILNKRIIGNNHISRINLDHERDDFGKSVGIVYGYLQNSETIKSFCEQSVRSVFNFSDNSLPNSAVIAMHIRALDALQHKEMYLDEEYYRKALSEFVGQESATVDVYSDDSSYARMLCSRIGDFEFRFPEEELALEPIQLLAKLSSYNRIIGSKSTLCWWASFLAELTQTNVQVISPWEAHLNLETWTTIRI